MLKTAADKQQRRESACNADACISLLCSFVTRLQKSAATVMVAESSTLPGCAFQAVLSMLPHSCHVHSLGFCKTDTSLASGEPCSGTTLYLQAIRGGADTMMDSSLPPDRPNLTPLSYNKLNSRYLPLLKSCHCRCSSVNDMLPRLVAISSQLGRMPSATSCTNCSQ